MHDRILIKGSQAKTNLAFTVLREIYDRFSEITAQELLERETWEDNNAFLAYAVDEFREAANSALADHGFVVFEVKSEIPGTHSLFAVGAGMVPLAMATIEYRAGEDGPEIAFGIVAGAVTLSVDAKTFGEVC